MNIGFLKGIWHLFTSPKAQVVEKQIEALVIAAQPYVQTIASMTPNRTFQEIAAVYDHYAVPFAKAEAALTDPKDKMNALADLVATLLEAAHKDAAASTVRAAVAMAVVVLKVNQ